MRNLLSLFGIGGASKKAGSPSVPVPSAATPQLLPPGDILFSTSTIADDMAALTEVGEPEPSDLVFHEDEWRQVEFFNKGRLVELTATLTELKAFSTTHRQNFGWSKVYIRRLDPGLVVEGSLAVASVAGELGADVGAGPVLFTGAALVGRVARGFTLPLGSGVVLYGFQDDEGIPVLGAFVASGGDDQALVRAFTKLSTSHELVLVDWRAQMLLVGVETDGNIKAFRP